MISRTLPKRNPWNTNSSAKPYFHSIEAALVSFFFRDMYTIKVIHDLKTMFSNLNLYESPKHAFNVAFYVSDINSVTSLQHTTCAFLVPQNILFFLLFPNILWTRVTSSVWTDFRFNVWIQSFYYVDETSRSVNKRIILQNKTERAWNGRIAEFRLVTEKKGRNIRRSHEWV